MSAGPVPAQSAAYRPRSYFPAAVDEQYMLLTRVKGTARRAKALELLAAEGFSAIPSELAAHSLRPEDRETIGRLDPLFMGGEYLPDQEAHEIEIARISILSTTGDVTSVYAQRQGRRIAYRVVDEYGGDTLSGTAECWSLKPLTMGDLVRFFLGTWDLLACLDMNFEGDDVERALDFFRAESEFYPYLDSVLRAKVRRYWHRYENTSDA